ncbi:oligosaccharide flippase family protein [Manganibacter manganicus]|nr:oligosaccharide flippase family protein [Pseudaminobacter manganicus]
MAVTDIIRRFLPAKSFARHVMTIAGATAFSQAISLAALPVLARLYPPGEYGTAAIYGSIVGLIVVVGSLRYEFAIPLPRTDGGALHVALLALAILVFIAVATGLVSPLLALWWEKEIGLSKWAFALLVVVGVLTAGAYQVTNYWAVRKSKFGAIARTRIQQGLAGPASQLALGFAGFGAIGLIVGQIVGQCAGLTRLALGMIADNRKPARTVHARGLAWAARRYRRFPLYDSWAGLLNIAGAQAPVLLFAALFSPILAGYYALALRVLSAPLGLIGQAISQVLMPRIIEANRRGEAGELVLKLFRILVNLSFFPFTIAAMLADQLVPFAFGPQWAPAGSIVAWTALWVACQFVTSPLSVVITTLEAQRLHIGVQVALFVLRICGILLGAAMASPGLAVVGFTIASILGYTIYLLAIGFVSGVRAQQFLQALIDPVLLSAFGAAALYVVVPSFLATSAALVILGGVWILRLNSVRLKMDAQTT